MITEGGEVGFVSRLVQESMELRDMVHLYSSLLGRKRSLRVILRLLRELNVPSVGSTVLYQGKTCRWCVCWSFDPAYHTAFEADPVRFKVFGRKKYASQRHEVEFSASEEEEEIWNRIDEFCKGCQGIQRETSDEIQVSGFVYHFPLLPHQEENPLTEESVRFSISVDEVEPEKCVVSFHILVGAAILIDHRKEAGSCSLKWLNTCRMIFFELIDDGDVSLNNSFFYNVLVCNKQILWYQKIPVLFSIQNRTESSPDASKHTRHP